MHRCPNVLGTARLREVIEDVARVETGVLPDPGGWQDQAATFVQACPVARCEIADWRAKHQEIAMRRAKQR